MPRKKGTPRASGGLTFLIATDLVKPDASTRKFIRSHVMIGKNAGRTLPPRRRKAVTTSTSATKQPFPSKQQSNDMTLALSPASRRFGTRLSTVALADEVDPVDVQSVLRFSSIAKQVLFPLEPCIFFENRAEEWIGPLSTDPAYLHCLIFTAQYFFDAKASGRRGDNVPVNSRTMAHFVKGLGMLKDRMIDEDSELRLSKSTAAAVMGLSAYALVTDDLGFAKRHIDGLVQIVHLRGGFSTFFGGSEKLLVEILRSDLGYALSSGNPPIFLTAVEGSPLFQFPQLRGLLESNGLPIAVALPDSLSELDDRLVDCWKVMTDFCTLINFATATGKKISTPIFLHVMTSTMYSLLSIHYEREMFDDMLRLGLLAFCSTAFLQWRSLDMVYTQFVTSFKQTMELFLRTDAASNLKLWLVVVGHLSLLRPLDHVLLHSPFPYLLENCRQLAWVDMRSIMQDFMWIPLLHDAAGAAVFERARRERHTELNSDG